MNAEEIEQRVSEACQEFSQDSFVFDLLLAYGLPQASITRLRKGSYNKAKDENEVLWKKKLCFRWEKDKDLHVCIDQLATSDSVKKHSPRFVIASDAKHLLAVDTKTHDTLDIPLAELGRNFDFFLPWAGLEKSAYQSEDEADIKAAARMGKLYDLIRRDNPTFAAEESHSLNVFMSRLLFCFFAEDTEIFPGDVFTNSIASHTAEDGSDLGKYLSRLFRVLNTEIAARADLPRYLSEFPYVNGGLFAEELATPEFSSDSRKIVVECGALDWKQINPDILGSMMQAVVHNAERDQLGMHYTSVPNILKLLRPLFLDELYEELEKASGKPEKLKRLLARLHGIRVFDPGCGSGNFLVIAYKELCRLEIKVLEELHGTQLSMSYESKIDLSHFFGIEIDDYAYETAKLSLWLAKHQMNTEFREVFGRSRPTLPLKDTGQLVCANALRLDWTNVCPKGASEVYVVGNPPYSGARKQTKDQKADVALIFDGHPDFKDADYVCCWFIKAAQFVRETGARVAFVATSSVCEGEQAAILWPRVLEACEIQFAHTRFKWTNNAKGNAGVTCVIAGFGLPGQPAKEIFTLDSVRAVKSVSPYLVEGDDTTVRAAKKTPNDRPKMGVGSMPRDDGNLILTRQESEELIRAFPLAKRFLRDFCGAQEFLKSSPRRCLWIVDEDLELAQAVPAISERIENVRRFRLASPAKTTRAYAKIPHKMAQRAHRPGTAILLPRHSSEQRSYIPLGFFDDSTVISDAALVLYDAPAFLFGILSSCMHMSWVRTVCGRIKTDYRYSAELCYNPFPLPTLSASQARAVEQAVYAVLDVREQYTERSLAQLYDTRSMPDNLKSAHRDLDSVVDAAYRSSPFRNDEDRIKYLFQIYRQNALGGSRA